MLTVGLVHHDDVGEFEHALLDALQLIAGARQGQEHEGVDHVGNGHLGLPDADRLDQDHVEPGGLEQHDGLAGGLATPPSVPDVGDGRMYASGCTARRAIRVLSPRIDPPVRVDDGSTASTATR